MLEKRITELISLGAQQWYLERNIATGFNIFGEKYVLSSIDIFLEILKSLGLMVTLRASRDLVIIREEFAKCAADSKLSADQATRLKKVMEVLRPTLWAESQGTIAYIISERRIPIELLMEDVGGLFGKDVFKSLPTLAQQDFSEAAKCLAFERPTAAAFHMLRATESVLRYFYCEKVKRRRANPMWGPMIQSMRQFPKRFSETLLNHLDHIRDGFRNPTAHPEKVYDLDEAQDLLSICVDVSNRMVQDLRK